MYRYKLYILILTLICSFGLISCLADIPLSATSALENANSSDSSSANDAQLQKLLADQIQCNSDNKFYDHKKTKCVGKNTVRKYDSCSDSDIETYRERIGNLTDDDEDEYDDDEEYDEEDESDDEETSSSSDGDEYEDYRQCGYSSNDQTLYVVKIFYDGGSKFNFTVNKYEADENYEGDGFEDDEDDDEDDD